MASRQWHRLSPSQRLDVMNQIFVALDPEAQSVLMRLAWALLCTMDERDVQAVSRVVDLLEINESPNTANITPV